MTYRNCCCIGAERFINTIDKSIRHFAECLGIFYASVLYAVTVQGTGVFNEPESHTEPILGENTKRTIARIEWQNVTVAVGRRKRSISPTGRARVFSVRNVSPNVA